MQSFPFPPLTMLYIISCLKLTYVKNLPSSEYGRS